MDFTGLAQAHCRPAVVKNTFLEFEDQDGIDDDPWSFSVPRRQQTDSAVERSRLRSALEQNIVATLRSHLGPPSSCGILASSPASAPSATIGRGLQTNPILVQVPPAADEVYPKAASVGGDFAGDFPSRQSSPETEAGTEPPLTFADSAGFISDDNSEAMGWPSEATAGWPSETTTSTSTSASISLYGWNHCVQGPGGPAPSAAHPPTSLGVEAEIPMLTPEARASPEEPFPLARPEVAEGQIPQLPLTCTTVMMRYIPAKYTQRKLMREINSDGFSGRYDFIYLPLDPRRRSNRSFAFFNLDSPETAQEFFTAYHGRKLRQYPCERELEVAPADIQGFEANAEHYMSVKAMRRSRDIHSQPLFMRSTNEKGYKFAGTQPAPNTEPSTPAPRAAVPSASGSWNQGALDKATAPPASSSWSPGALRQAAAPPASSSWSPGALRQALQQVQPSLRAPQQWSRSWNAPTPRFCSNCGQPKETEHSFCPFCGTKFFVPQQHAGGGAPLPGARGEGFICF